MGIYYHYNEWGHLVFIHGELFENSYYHYLTCKSTTYIHRVVKTKKTTDPKYNVHNCFKFQYFGACK